MRFVNKDLSDIPSVFASARVIAEYEKIINGDKGLIKEGVYKGLYKINGKTESQVRDVLNKYYLGKCAYCEMHCKAEIEHYRPKKGVEEDGAHPGYYWLCYEWSNLVPSCRYCNTEGGKGNKFPITGTRVENAPVTHGVINYVQFLARNNPLLAEEARLLHPEIDHPNQFFSFGADPGNIGIQITGIDARNRGTETIRICNLNSDYKKLNRKEIIYPLISKFDLIFKQVDDGILDMSNLGKALKLCFLQMEENSQNMLLTHTLLRWYVVNSVVNFVSVIGPEISNNNQREIIIQAFANYKNGLL